MEPRYVADNGSIDAFAVAWLFQEDHLFFNDDEIVWDGSHHCIKGMQNNAASISEIPLFVGNIKALAPGVIDFLLKLEQQENLRVPRKSIHRALYPAIRKGDLTGLTLFNLLACAKAIMIKNLDADSYAILYDTNLSKGIPRFSELIGNLITFMREYNEIAGDFTIMFMGSRNFDFAEAFLGGALDAVSSPVAGAKLEPSLSLSSGRDRTHTNGKGGAISTKSTAEESMHQVGAGGLSFGKVGMATKAVLNSEAGKLQAGTELSDEEPQYLDDQDKFRSEALLQLLSGDYLFFNPGEITWDGERHAIAGVRINSAKAADIPLFVENAGELFQSAAVLLANIEEDGSLVVGRSAIHRGLYDAIREGDLTGITLLNLCACARSWFVPDGDITSNVIMVSADNRLLRGIPNFCGLVGKLINDLRKHNGFQSSFTLVVASVTNVEADQYLGEVDCAVADAEDVLMRKVVVDDLFVSQMVNCRDTALSSASANDSSKTDVASTDSGAPSVGVAQQARAAVEAEEEKEREQDLLVALLRFLKSNEMANARSIADNVDVIGDAAKAEALCRQAVDQRLAVFYVNGFDRAYACSDDGNEFLAKLDEKNARIKSIRDQDATDEGSAELGRMKMLLEALNYDDAIAPRKISEVCPQLGSAREVEMLCREALMHKYVICLATGFNTEYKLDPEGMRQFYRDHGLDV